MSLRTGGREAVEDTPVTGATEEQIREAATRESAIYLSHHPSANESHVHDAFCSIISGYAASLVPVGYAIVRAEDALTADDRAAIGRMVEFMNTDDDDTPYGDDIDQFEADVATLSAIAAGGQV